MGDKLKHLTTPLLLFAGLLIALPLMELADAVWPMRPGNVEWRFGATGLLSKTLLQPLLGSIIIVVVATQTEKKRLQDAMWGLNAIAAVFLLLVLPLFMLDSLQLRGRVPVEAKFRFDLATIKAVLVYGSALVVLAALSWGGFKSSQRVARRSRDRSKEPAPLVVQGK